MVACIRLWRILLVLFFLSTNAFAEQKVYCVSCCGPNSGSIGCEFNGRRGTWAKDEPRMVPGPDGKPVPITFHVCVLGSLTREKDSRSVTQLGRGDAFTRISKAEAYAYRLLFPKFKVERDYQFKTTRSPGLNTDILTFPSGSKLTINFPNDIAVGDTFSGTLRTEVSGKDEEERASNQAEIERSLLLLGGQPIRATENTFTRTIPQRVNAGESFVVLKVKGKKVVNAQLPISQTPAPPTANTQLPGCGQIGRNVVVIGRGDGIIAPNDYGSIGGTPLQPLAESPRMRVMQNTSQVTGPTELKYSELGKQVSGPFNNLGVTLTSPNTNLLRGQSTTLEVVVLAHGIQQDVSFDLVSDTPGIVTISGGDNQHFTIHPSDVQADGTYKRTFTVTAHSAGGWGATASVSCVGKVTVGQ